MSRINTIQIAKSLHAQGIASIPIADSRSKRPPRGLKWGELSDDNYDKAKIEEIYSQPHEALAVMGGFISTGLEILDVDLKHSRDPEQLWTDLMTNIEAALPDFHEKCTIAKTPSGGYHIYYSCWEIEGNKKLAYEDHAGKRLCVIETRGDGGYALTWPSEGYEITQGGIDRFAYALGTDERDTLHEICQIFNEEVEDVAYQETKRFVPKGRNFIRNPFDDYRDRVPFHEVESLIREAGFEKPKQKGPRVFFHRIGSDNEQGANYHLEKKCLYVWTSNSRLSPDRGYNPTSLLCEIRHGGDWKETFKWLIKNGYGQRIKPEDETYIHEAYQQLSEGVDSARIKEDLKEQSLEADQAEKYLEIAQNRLVRMDVFWEETDKGAIKVDPVKLKYFLQDHGIKTFKSFPDDPNSVLVRFDDKGHTVKQIDIAYVKKYLEDYLNDEEMAFPEDIRNGVLRELIKMTTRFFNAPVFEWVDVVVEGIDVSMLKDTTVYSYMFFRNHIVKISASKPKFLNYEKLDPGVYVWEKSIIDRDVPLINMNDPANLNASEYFRFLKRLAGMGTETDKMNIQEMFVDHEYSPKLQSFISAIGYLSHSYNDRKRMFAVIVAEDIEDSNRGGGTGKGILLRSLTCLRNCIYEPGKTFEPRSQFAFEKWKPGTNIYLIDDVDRKFDFEGLYNYITDGGKVNRKYQSAFELPFEELPKFRAPDFGGI